MDILQWKEKNKSTKGYSHFDKRVSIINAWSYITDPENIIKHGFYPFIHYTQKFYKYTKQKGRYLKERQLFYSSHIDRCIYQYYSYLLNQHYNEYLKCNSMENVPIAYRDNINKSNIEFSKQAFDFIKSYKDSYIIVGDYTNFFDRLNHEYLKEQLCNLLGVNKLPDDYYAVYKNITRFSMWDLTDLLNINGLKDNKQGRKSLNSLDIVLPLKKFRDLKKEYIHKHFDKYGIPQGSAISAVLSNIFMLELDILINNYILTKNGKYMRYSDDFIIIIPNVSKYEFLDINQVIKSYIDNVPDLKLEPNKTQIFRYVDKDKKIYNCNDIIDNLKGKDILNYLGFSFNGDSISIRDKTISKYYYRMYRKIKNINKNDGYTSNGKKISCKRLYELYTFKGINKGNFLTYVKRAQNIYGEEQINRPVKNHMQKIKKAMKFKTSESR